MKRILSIILALCLVVSLLPAAFAEEDEPNGEPEQIAEEPVNNTAEDTETNEEPETPAEPEENEEPSAPQTDAEEAEQQKDLNELEKSEEEEPEEQPAEGPEDEPEGIYLPGFTSETIRVVNPVYQDIISEDELLVPHSSIAAFMLLDEDPIPSPEDPAAFLRQAMVAREETVTFTVDYKIAAGEFLEDNKNGSRIWSQAIRDQVGPFVDAAKEHTGVPSEGDYLLYQFYGYSAYWTYHDVRVPSNPEAEVTVPSEITYVLTYYTSADQEEAVTAKVSQIISDFGLDPYASDYEKLYKVNEYLSNNVTYDHANLGNSSYKLQFTAYAALINGTSVCQGYANAFYRLALELGVDCRIVAGTGITSTGSGGHAWNIVRLGGSYYDADATWDATYYGAYHKYHYFLMTEEEFCVKHVRREPYDTAAFLAAYPMATQAYVPAQRWETSAFRTEEDYTAPKQEEKTFAGWYLDEALTIPVPADNTEAKAYAKFVDEDVLTVKWQASGNLSANSESTNLRFITTVDSLKYSNVGFRIQFANEDGTIAFDRDYTTRTVYTSLNGYFDNQNHRYTPADTFCEESSYFMAYRVNNIPSSAFNGTFTVTPFWTTHDGTQVTGKPLSMRVWNAIG